MKIKFNNKYNYFKQFEMLVNKYWVKSHDEGCINIHFDLSGIQYMDLMQICHLFMWAESLLREDKEVHFNFKINNNTISDFYNVIKSYGFISQLSLYSKFTIEPVIDFNHTNKNINISDSALIHITKFESLNDLDNFLDNIKKSSSRNNENNLLDRTGVRDVILKEIGYNVFVHAKGSPALIAVCRKDADKLKLTRNPKPYQLIEQNRSVDEFIQVVICDLGPGIPKKINESFSSDNATKGLEPTCNNLVEYSFWKDTSSRDRRAQEEIEKITPPTGLYFVKRLVEKHNGLLCVRTSNCIWSQVYTSNGVKKYNEDIWGMEELENIPGNVIQIIIPVYKNTPSRIDEVIDHTYDLPEIEHYISFASDSFNHGDEKQATETLLDKSRKATHRGSTNKGIIVDLNNESLHLKRLFQIALKLIYLQEINRPIILVNVPQGASWIGACDEIDRLLKQSSSEDNHYYPLPWFSDSEKGLLNSAAEDDEQQLNFSLYEIDLEIDKVIKKRVADKINSTYSDDMKVSLPGPSNIFIKGFFNFPTILDDVEFCKDYNHLIKTFVSERNLCAIITTSTRLVALAKIIAHENDIQQNHVFYQSSTAAPLQIMLDIQKIEGDSVLLLADAVVSGATTKKITKNISSIGKNVVRIALLADHKVSDFVFAPMYHDFESYDTKPADWSYDDVRLIDVASHQILEGEVKSNVFENITEEKLSTWAEEDKAVAIGHYSNDDTCYLIFFDTYKIQEVYEDQIFEDIREDLKSVIKINKSNKLIFGCPVNNQAAIRLSEMLKKYMGGDVEFIPKGEKDIGIHNAIMSKGDENKDEMLVFIDTATSTTKTLRRAMEWAAYKKRGMLQAYLIINRALPEEYSFINGITTFKGVEIRLKTLTTVQIPAYDTTVCPACKRSKLILDNIKKHNSQLLKNALEQEATKLDLKPIKEARGTILGKPANTVPGFGKALYFRQLLEQSTLVETMASVPEMIKVMKEIASSTDTAKLLINIMWHEIQALLHNKYARIWNDDLRDLLLRSCIDVTHEGDGEDDYGSKAIWLSASINYGCFIDAVWDEKWKLTNSTCKTLAIAVTCFSTNKTINKSIDLLKRVSFKVESNNDNDIDKDVMSILREVAVNLEFDLHSEHTITNTYTWAINTLAEIFEERGRSHSKARTSFDDLRRMTVQEDLIRILEMVHDDDGFMGLFKNKIYPAIVKVKLAWPDDYISKEPYIATDQMLKDINELISEIEVSAARQKSSGLLEKEWVKTRTSIRDTAKKIELSFISVDTSCVLRLLETCKSSVSEVIGELKATYCDLLISNEQNIILNEMSSCEVLMPHNVIYDIIRTIIVNAINYSNNGTDIIFATHEMNETLILSVSSSPLNDNKIELKEGHGLHYAKDVLHRYDGSLEISENEGTATIKIEVPKR